MIAVLPQSQPVDGKHSSKAMRTLRLAYLTTEYPKVSHTFIRREIFELERRGHVILRLAIRSSGGAVADAADADEGRKTFTCLTQPGWKFVIASLQVLLSHPMKSLRGLRAAFEMYRRSERGVIAHLAYLAEAALLLRKTRQENIQHVHVHFGTNSAAVARLIRILGGPPYSMTVHGPNEFDAAYGFSLREKVTEAAFVIAISDFCASQIRRWAPYEDWHKIHVVRCTVGEEFFEPVHRIAPDSRRLLCIGRLSAQKGQHLLIEAMRQLIEEGIDAHLVLAGDGEMRPEIERHIAECGLQSHISITGWIDERAVREQLLNARALVQPSFAEGLPVVIMESLAMARPVISTMIAGIPELVRHEENGWLVTAGNLEELVTAMRTVLTTPTERLNQMGAAGRQRVHERHFTESEVGRLEKLFDQYLKSNETHVHSQEGTLSASGLKSTQQNSARGVSGSRQKGWAGVSG